MTSGSRDEIRIEDSPKRVRTYLGGEAVADTKRARLVWEVPYYPAYYFPQDDVRVEWLTETGEIRRTGSRRGDAHVHDVKVGDNTAVGAASTYPDSPVEELRQLVRFDWGAMDHWFEEDEEVHVHPRDPYTRVDILASSRHVEVVVNGIKVADSHQPLLLFETSLPTRYYLPLTDLRMDLLVPSPTVTRCPYKGTASYWSVRAGGKRFDDIVWTYPAPLLESVKIAGRACFYNDKVDLILDGIAQQ